MGWNKKQKQAMKELREAEGCKRDFWYEIKTQADIDFLLQSFGGFHDSVLVRSKYQNGRWDSRGWPTDVRDEEVISLFFRSQRVDPEIELKFIGVKRFHLVGYQSKYSSEIFDCHLSFFNDGILFADHYDFNLKDGYLLKSNEDGAAVTFVVADSLSWRFTTEHVAP
ncbi:MAG: hypothetical protein LBR37_02850 [Erysipelotrichaceae bacterium]|jgi:hypothetical protein|nr:hypothetical protein [Erysipelotrichaceae bacterium]